VARRVCRVSAMALRIDPHEERNVPNEVVASGYPTTR
jgi:hypothetical protein